MGPSLAGHCLGSVWELCRHSASRLAGEQCSAAAALGMLKFFLLNHQADFDVKWPRGAHSLLWIGQGVLHVLLLSHQANFSVRWI